jgi:hypothetical protein
MRRALLRLGLLGVAVGTTAANGGPVRGAAWDPAADLQPNSCAITCPAGSAYSGLSGSVGCSSGFAPACQCSSSQQRMASCERLTGK